MRRSAFLCAGAAAAATTGIPVLGAAQVLRQSTIGINVPLSGRLQNFGAEIVRGAQAAIDETNRYTPLAGRSFGIRTFDDQGSPTLAITNVQIAQADPSAIAMIGNLTADATLNALPSYANAGFALIVPTVTSDVITARGFRNVFRISTKDSAQGQLVARSELSGRSRIRAIAAAMEDGYGSDVADGFVREARTHKHDADTVLLSRKATPAQMAQNILDKLPQYVFLCGTVADLGPVAEALRLAHYTGTFACSDGFYTSATTDKYATVLEGSLVATPLPPLDRVTSQTIQIRDFEQAVGQISAFAAYGYASAQLIIAAAQRANAQSRTSLLTALQQSGTYTTLVGQYQFNYQGDALIPDVYLYSVTAKDGFKYEKPAFRTGFVT